MSLIPQATSAATGDLHSSEACAEKFDAFWLAGPEFSRRSFDPATGRAPRQYPPDRKADLVHMKLEATVDMAGFALAAHETLTFIPLGQPLASLTLDGVGLRIGTITDGAGSALDQYYDGQRLTILFPQPLPVGAESSVVISYDCVKPPTGLHYAAQDAAHPGRPPMLHSQGETEDNRYWFFTHDAPNEKLTTELIITVPRPNEVISNGRLVGVSDGPSGSRAYHWLQDKPHAAYLVSLCVGQWDTVTEEWRGKPVTYHVPVGRAADGKASYGKTPEMLEFFSTRLDEPYPWDRYAQVVVENFSFGGMENTSATTMWEGCILDEVGRAEGDIEGIVSHELGHQWFGDLMTCESWDHIWLNEGFATYSSHLWFEHSRGQDDYVLGIRDTMNGVAGSDKCGIGMAPMVYNDFVLGQDTFFRAGANPYGKGCCVLAMLRAELGDALFFKGLARYIDERRFTAVESDDLRSAFEAESGRDLRWFFDQWVYRAGTPELAIKAEYDAAAGRLNIEVEQTQPMSREEPAFRLTLPIWVKTPAGERVLRLDMRERKLTLSESLPAAPLAVVVDPWAAVLATKKVNMPQPWWEAQARMGPTVAARVEALGRLAESAETSLIAGIPYFEYLRKIVYDPSQHLRMRTDAATNLSRGKSETGRRMIIDLLDQGISDPRIRNALLASLANFEDGADLARFAAAADPAGESSYACRATAISALARLKAADRFELIAAAVGSPSGPTGPMGAAVDALATLGDDRSLSELLRVSAYANGYPFRIRAQAIRNIPRCAKSANLTQDRRAVVEESLVALLHDPERRAFEASFDALVDYGVKSAVEPIRVIERTTLVPRFRIIAKWAADTLEKSN